MPCARVEVVKVQPQLEIARVEAAKMAPQIGLLYCGLVRVRIESGKKVS